MTAGSGWCLGACIELLLGVVSLSYRARYFYRATSLDLIVCHGNACHSTRSEHGVLDRTMSQRYEHKLNIRSFCVMDMYGKAEQCCGINYI